MKVSIVTITYNSQNTLQNTIDSISRQSYRNIEYIIVDGNSTDRTKEIIKSNLDTITRWISEPDNGIYDAMNKGLKIATGEVIGFLNSDDSFYDNQTISTIIESFNSNECDCIFGNLIYTNTNGKTIRKWKSRSYRQGLFNKSWTPAHPTFYCKKKLYDQYGVYKIDYSIAADVELMLRFLEVHKVKSHYIDKVLVNMLAGGVSNQGLGSTLTIIKEIKRAFRENNLKFNLFKYLFYKSLKIKELMINER